jgi:hypothetical protein
MPLKKPAYRNRLKPCHYDHGTDRMREVSFIVEGSGEFPFDMLRYDSCFPRDEGQARQMGDTHERRRVHLVRRIPADVPFPEPTVARWESFLWRVVPLHELEEHERIYP